MMRKLLAAGFLLVGSAAAACPLCTGTAARSSSQDLTDLPRAVLAAPQGKGYKIVAVIKGETPAPVLEDVVVRDPAVAGKTLLLVRDDAWPMWVSLGSTGAQNAAVLRGLAVKPPPADDAAAWRRRLDLALPHLASRDALLAEIAYDASASAPYAALRAARPKLDAAVLRRVVGDPALASRQPLHVLLLGIAGDARDAAFIEAQLDAALVARDPTNVGALLAADLELRGASRLAWVEDRYLRDRSRTTAEMQAALLALGVQANSGGAITRERVIDAYRVFMREHPDMAGLVAPDLAAWRYWDAAPEYQALLKGNVRQQYASLAAIVSYLRESELATGAR
ncbi:MAG: hypothetical protein U1F54_20195 [Burkholderiales bacterium]